MKHNKLNVYHEAGFSLIELMLAMLIGLIIMSGVMSLYLTTRDTQRSSEDQLALLGDARFAIETLAYDLRHTALWGETNEWESIACHDNSPANMACTNAAMPAAVGDCNEVTADFPAGFKYTNLKEALFGSNGVNPFGSSCAINSYKASTDILGVRYADSTRIDTASLGANVAFVRSNIKAGELFVGPTAPTNALWYRAPEVNEGTRNHLLVSRVYYVSTYTNAVGDGLPSLHRVNLVAGPEMKDEVLLPGVEDFQLEFGVDSNCDGQVNTYVNAANVTAVPRGDCPGTSDPLLNWSNGAVIAVKIWLLMRSNRVDRDNISSSYTFTIASGTPVTIANDGYRRVLVSSVVKLRNTSRRDLLR